MEISSTYQITPDILKLIVKIDANQLFFSSLKVPAPLKEKIERISLLKSSLFSARIEGNPLTLEELDSSSNKQKKIEIFNILKSIEYINKNIQSKVRISENLILKLHTLAMKDIFLEAGRFRKEIGAIFNQSGVAIYISPPPDKISFLIERLLDYINTDKERFPLLSAFITHLFFEKIHPFIDGNGRVGRLLIYAVLKSRGYDFGFFIPFEEYLDTHKEQYYYHLDIGLKKTEEYLLFMLQAFYNQIEKTRKNLINEMEKKEILFLPPRQEEIFYVIKDHKIVSFDFIRRRFLKIPTRTLRYDLKKLQEQNLIIKIGKTKGSYYRIKP